MPGHEPQRHADLPHTPKWNAVRAALARYAGGGVAPVVAATLRAIGPTRHVLTIPNWHPPRTNEWAWRHWRVKHRLQTATNQIIGCEAVAQGVPKAAGVRRVALLLSGWARGGRLPDRDAYDKVLLDALTDAGLLLDDGARGMDGRMAVEFVRGEKWSRIVLEDV